MLTVVKMHHRKSWSSWGGEEAFKDALVQSPCSAYSSTKISLEPSLLQADPFTGGAPALCLFLQPPLNLLQGTS